MLYLIKSGDYIKIGFSDDVVNRMKSYKTCNPDFQILDIQIGSETDEKNWHERLLMYKYRGEWFHFNQKILELWNSEYNKNIQVTLKTDLLKVKEEQLNFKEDQLLYRENYILNNLKNMVEQNQPIYDYLVEKLRESDYSTYIQTLKGKDRLINEMSQVIKDLTEMLNIKYKPIYVN